MKLSCPAGCHKCCTLFTYISKEDFERWIAEDRMDIIACLTWNRIHGRMPKDLIFIPQKRHMIGHSYLQKFFKPEWAKSEDCIFLNEEGRCNIYPTRPEACRNFPQGKLDFDCPGKKDVEETDKAEERFLSRMRLKSNLLVYKERETFSAVIKRAKEQASLRKVAKLLGYTPSEALKEADDERREEVRTIDNIKRDVET
jgi:Fe-S-cluster containining protein